MKLRGVSTTILRYTTMRDCESTMQMKTKVRQLGWSMMITDEGCQPFSAPQASTSTKRQESDQAEVQTPQDVPDAASPRQNVNHEDASTHDTRKWWIKGKDFTFRSWWWLHTWLVCGTCNHVYHANHMADMGRLNRVTCWFPGHADILGIRKGWCNLNLRWWTVYSSPWHKRGPL
jgi:hypothetical protein